MPFYLHGGAGDGGTEEVLAQSLVQLAQLLDATAVPVTEAPKSPFGSMYTS